MKILHTSDWHIGRTFHQTSTLDALSQVFDALIDAVATRGVDVVLASGDIFDSTTPSAEAVKLLDSILIRLNQAGAKVVMTSGNHDSPARLGAKAAFAHLAGIHVVTDPDDLTIPVSIADEHGPVHFYGIPFLEPALQRGRWPDVQPLRSQRDALGHAIGLIQADMATRGGRFVVLAHTFAQGAEGESCDSERDIVGGVDKVPVSFFTNFHYAALGHIHGRAQLAPSVRYSGAPLHYSFSEADKPRGGWLVELDATGFVAAEWVDLPVPRRLTKLRGDLAELLANPDYQKFEDDWVSATITDPMRPMNTLRKLQSRFAHTVELSFEPSAVTADSEHNYAQKLAGKTDLEVIDTFLVDVRNGHGSTDAEKSLLRDATAGRAQR